MTRPTNSYSAPRLVTEGDTAGVIALFREFMAEIALDPAAPPVARYVRRAVDEELSRLGECYLAGPRQGFWVIDAVADARASSAAPGSLVGTVGVQQVDDTTAELRRMIVARAHRRTGLGRGLLAHAEQFARAARYDTMVLGTSSLQPAAVRLYRLAGYPSSPDPWIPRAAPDRSPASRACASFGR